MPRELHGLIATPVAAPVPERSRTERLLLPAAIFWIVVLSLAGWTFIILLAFALGQTLGSP